MGWAYSLLMKKLIIPLSLATLIAAGPASAQMRARAIISMPSNAVGAAAAAPIPSSFSAPVISGLTAPVSLIPIMAAPSMNAAMPAPIPVMAAAAIPVRAVAAVPAAAKDAAVLAIGVRAFVGKDGKPAGPADLDRGFDGRSSASDLGATYAGEAAPAAITPDEVRALMTLGRAKGAREYTRGRGWERATFTLGGENGGRLVIQEHSLGEETSRSLFVSFTDAAGTRRTIKVDEDANGRIVLPNGPDGDVFAMLVREWTVRLSPAPAVTPDGIRKLMAAVNRAGARERTSGRNWESTTYTAEAEGGRKIVVRESWLGGRGGISESTTRALTMIFTGKDGSSRALSVTEDADGRIVLENGPDAADFEAEFVYWTRALTP